jgi:hypothetical protein
MVEILVEKSEVWWQAIITCVLEFVETTPTLVSSTIPPNVAKSPV